MCDCIKEICYKIKEAGGYVNVDPPVELLSGRVYLSFTCREFGKKRTKEIPLMLSKCPFCGEEYKQENWNQVISEVSDLINESRDKKNELATEVIAQAKRITRRWFTAWVITLVALIVTNIIWMYMLLK